MDELDRLSASMLAKAEPDPKTPGSSGALAPAKPMKTVSFATNKLPTSTPPSKRVWIIGDYNSEMITALCALGIAAGDIRSWNTPRCSNGPRPHLLEKERPAWLFINKPRAMVDVRSTKKYGDHAAYTRSLIASLLEAQAAHGGEFAMFGNPMWPTWDAQEAPELAKVYQD